MGGYFTQSRREDFIFPGNVYTYTSLGTTLSGIPVPAEQVRDQFFGLPAVNSRVAPPSQVTTSYRTGGGVPYIPDDGSEVLDQEPANLAGEFGFLKSIEESNTFRSNGYDTGHTFSTVKHEVEMSHPHTLLSGSGLTYLGPLLPWDNTTSPATTWPTVGTTSSSSASLFGSQAISATAPTNPASSFGTGLYETLIDGLPRLPGEIFHTGESLLRNLAHGHLSIQFDWLPFVGDLRSAINALKNASRILKQYERDSGRMVRRSFTFPTSRTVTKNGQSSTVSTFTPPGMNSNAWLYLAGTKGTGTAPYQLQRHTVKTQEVYFKGAYSYFLPKHQQHVWDAFDEYIEKADHLLGLDLTPELLWQLAPWSWLIDWKLSIGTVMKSFSAFHTDGLVLRYGYLMVKTTTENVLTINNLRVRKNGNLEFVNPYVVYRTIRKERLRGTPYGFGVDPASFSTKQWSILGALGMTRSPSKLRLDD